MASKRVYGVDVSAYQPANLSNYRRAGAQFVLIKASEGTWYRSPVASAQIHSAHHSGFSSVHAYHFANFSASSFRARREAKYFLAQARRLNIAHSRYLALDWEGNQYNYTGNSKEANTNAILAFMHVIKKAGYKPMLYSSASLLRYNIDLARVARRYGTCVWVASYATMGRIDWPNYGYFPSMNAVAIWQFTDDWRGLNVDGNVSFIDLAKSNGKHKKAKSKPKKPVVPKEVYAPIINGNPNWLISLRDGKGHGTGKYILTNTHWKVCGVKSIHGHIYYKLGTDKQWVPAKYLQIVR